MADALSTLSGRISTHTDGKAYDRILVPNAVAWGVMHKQEADADERQPGEHKVENRQRLNLLWVEGLADVPGCGPRAQSLRHTVGPDVPVCCEHRGLPEDQDEAGSEQANPASFERNRHQERCSVEAGAGQGRNSTKTKSVQQSWCLQCSELVTTKNAASQVLEKPSSTGRSTPVTCGLSPQARKTTAAAISSGWAKPQCLATRTPCLARPSRAGRQRTDCSPKSWAHHCHSKPGACVGSAKPSVRCAWSVSTKPLRR